MSNSHDCRLAYDWDIRNSSRTLFPNAYFISLISGYWWILEILHVCKKDESMHFLYMFYVILTWKQYTESHL